MRETLDIEKSTLVVLDNIENAQDIRFSEVYFGHFWCRYRFRAVKTELSRRKTFAPL